MHLINDSDTVILQALSILCQGPMDVAANAQRVGGGGGRAECVYRRRSGLEVNLAAGGDGRPGGGVGGGTFQPLRRKERENTLGVKGGQSTDIKRESNRTRYCKEKEEGNSESDIYKHLSGFPKDFPDNRGQWPSKQAISYEEMAHTAGLVGTGRPPSELSICEAAGLVKEVGAGDSER